MSAIELDATHLVYMTVATKEEATALARLVVQERLAACANIISEVTSVYEWEGQLHEDAEVVVVLKTQQSQVKTLMERLVAEHSYDCPCVVDVRLSGGNPEFLQWLTEQTR